MTSPAGLRRPWWLAIPSGLVAVACGATIWQRTTDADAAEVVAAYWALATLAALIAWYIQRRRRRVRPFVPGDDAAPIRVRWTWGRVSSQFGPDEAEAHVTSSALHLVAYEWRLWDAAVMVLSVVPGALGGGCAGCAAFPALLYAHGFPRMRRAALDVPWDDIRRVAVFPSGRFLVWRSAGDRVAIEISAKFSQRDRLVAALGEKLGDRFGAAGAADAAVVAVPDAEDRGLAEEVWLRVTSRPSLVIATVAWAATVVVGLAVIVTGGIDEAIAVSFLSWIVCLVALLFAKPGASSERWTRTPHAPGDTPFWFAVRWANRRGWPGPRLAEAHFLPHALRVVATEWETWDSLVVLAAMLLSLLGGCWGVIATWMLVRTLSLPRRRRVAVDVCWPDVTRVDVRGPRISIATRLAEPHELIVLETKYAHRDGLVGSLTDRVGDRVFVDSRVRNATGPLPSGLS